MWLQQLRTCDNVEFLEGTAIHSIDRQTRMCKLVLDEVRRDVQAVGSDSPPFQLVRRKKFNIIQQPLFRFPQPVTAQRRQCTTDENGESTQKGDQSRHWGWYPANKKHWFHHSRVWSQPS